MRTKIYIIHGWTYNLDKWTKFVQILKSKNIETIQLKVPGLTQPSQKAWDINEYVQWLDSELGNEQNPVILAHSNGGRIALAYAQQNPGRIKKLILIDSAGVINDQQSYRLKIKLLRNLSKAGKLVAHGPVIKKLFYKVIGASDYNDAPPNMKKTMQNMLRADQAIDLSKIKLPLTIIWGREDRLTPLRDAYKLEKNIAGSTLDIVDSARHAPFYTQPDKVADILMKRLGLE